MIRIVDDGDFLTVEASGRLTREDYQAQIPRPEQEIERRGGLNQESRSPRPDPPGPR